MSGTWTTLTCTGVPSARHENCFVECNEKFYLMAGRRVQPTDEFDPSTNTWRALSAPPVELHHFQAFSIEGRIWVFGAMSGPYPNEPPLDCVYLFDPATDTWSKGPEIPSHRRRGSGGSVFHDGKIYWVGGIQLGHDHGTINWFDSYDIETGKFEELPEAPTARDHFPAALADGRLYCIGGRNTSVHTENNFEAFFHSVIREVDYFDFDSNRWLQLENNLPVGTAAGSIAQIEGKLLYIGGESGVLPAHRDVQALDLESREWSQLMPLNTGRHGTQAIVHDGSVFIASGSGNRGGGPELTSIERLDL